MGNKKVLGHKCPTCDAPINYSAKLKKWKCEYCSNEFTLKEIKERNKFIDSKKDNYDSYIVYKCENCGAEIVTDEQTSATFCVYCGNTAILRDKLSGKFAPDLIIPFKKEKEEAIKAFSKLGKGRPLMPKDFNKQENINKIKGIYIPFWLYDIELQGSVNAKGTKVKTWHSFNTTYTKTDIYSLKRTGAMNFYKVPIDASLRFDNSLMNSLEPFLYDELEEFNHSYLAGFYAEKYDFDDIESYQEVANRAYMTGREEMMQNCKGYTSTTYLSDDLKVKPTKKYYVLLPVWMVNVKYKDKMYTFAMNGQTGEFIGDIPLDKKKAVIYGSLVFIITFLLIILISYILYFVGV